MSNKEKFIKARAGEMRFRLMVHVRAICWLRVSNRDGVFAHAPVVPMTERHRLELILASCAFFRGLRPEREDVKRFLWRLNPAYRAPVVGREKWLARRFLGVVWMALACESIRAAFAYARLRSMVEKCDVAETSAEIVRFIAQSEQDAPGGEETETKPKKKKRRSSAAPPRCYADNFVEHVMRNYGLTPDQALDLPIALFNQLYREHLLSQPDGELAVFAPSDALLV